MIPRVFPVVAGVLVLAACAHGNSGPAQAGASTWSPAIEEKLKAAGTNSTALVTALQKTSGAEREAMEFLVENMPVADARSLSADYLMENVRLACAAMKAAPWQAQVPKEIFLNEVLPYACLNETREAWRQRLHDLCAPLVADCRTPGEAAQRLNQKLFPLLKVRYSTERKRPDQGPGETMASGKATCTGLAILLVDACRSVGVPARVAGTPMWANLRGNHTWVEVWDGGWHFTGAAEPDPQGLDRGWFVQDASQAKRDVPRHAVYATSFQQTEVHFPLVWVPHVTSVSAVNVTDRYTPKAAGAANGMGRLLIKVLAAPAGQRVASEVTVTDGGTPATVWRGTSKDESADLNDILAFEVTAGSRYLIAVTQGGRVVRREISAGTNRQELVTIPLTDPVTRALASPACSAPPPVLFPLAAAEADPLQKAFADYFSASAEQRTHWKFSAGQEQLLRENDPAVRRLAWEAYRSTPIHDALKQDFDAKQVRFEQHLSAYAVKTVGARPANGWALFIALHGGGGAPKTVNDSQWKQMQIYYHDHAEAGGYLYVALRAPNDTWNGFYDVYVYPLIANLIRQFTLFGDVDANKVFLLGYSHGGYGAFAIGPKMPDRFAALHASAAAPTDGETTATTLRNTLFTCMVGEKDTRYGRFDRNRQFAAEVEKLRGDRHDIYPVRVDIKEGFGHSGLPDRDQIKEMYPAVRNPIPRELSWLMTDQVITDFFWLRVEKPSKQQEMLASCRDNRFVVTANSNVVAATVLFDSRLVDFNQPVRVELNGVTTSHTFTPRLKTLAESLLRRGDPELAFTASFEVRREESSGRMVVEDEGIRP
ncbi:MAG: transglutaminase domain-containing protein [Verrucomicrobiota bacterium]